MTNLNSMINNHTKCTKIIIKINKMNGKKMLTQIIMKSPNLRRAIFVQMVFDFCTWYTDGWEIRQKTWYRDSQIVQVWQAHLRTILVKVTPPRFTPEVNGKLTVPFLRSVVKQKHVDATYKISHILRNVYATNMILVSLDRLCHEWIRKIKRWD